MDQRQPSSYPVGRADSDDNKNQRFWVGVQSTLALLARGVPNVGRFLGSLAVGPYDPFSSSVGSVASSGALAGFIAYDRAGTPGNYVTLYRDATNFYVQTAEGAQLPFNATTGRGLTKQLVSYTAVTDLMNATAITASTWTTLATVTSFTPANANSTIRVAMRGVCNLTAAAGVPVAGRVLIDGATAYPISGGITGPATSYINVLGGVEFPIGSLSAAAHTIVVQVYAGGAGTGFCRALTLPNTEFLHVDIWEVRS